MVIDLSVYQGVVNWSAIKAASIELAIIKATEGIGFEDPRFRQNWDGAKAAGVPRGAYAFVHPDLGNDPTAEADYFLSVVNPEPGDVLAEDYEVPGGGAAWSLAFLDRLQGRTNALPVFYSNYSGCFRVSDTRMAAYPLWLAYPGDGIHVPPCPTPWSTIRLWQYAVGSVPGIAGNVDEDVNLGLFSSGSGSLTAPTRRRKDFVATSDNHQLFKRGPNNDLQHNRFDGTNWSGWISLGGILESPEIAVTGAGQRLDIYVIGGGGIVYHTWSTDAGATFAAFQPLGGDPSDTALDPIIAVGPAPGPVAPTPVDLSAVNSKLDHISSGVDAIAAKVGKDLA